MTKPSDSMYSAKRKIQNILHHATSRSSTSLKSPSTASLSTADPVQSTTIVNTTSNLHNPSLVALEEARKKRRLVEAQVRAHSHPATSDSIAREDSSSPPPIRLGAVKYAPWDRIQFLERLATFRSVSNWNVKPEAVNEVAWAKRGWVCVGAHKNRVRCSAACGGEVVVKIEFDDYGGDGGEEDNSSLMDNEEEKTEALVKKYEELIVEGHETDCLWRKRGCDAAIYRLPLQPPAGSRTEFYKRYQSLLEFDEASLPTSLVSPVDLDVDTLKLPPDLEVKDSVGKDLLLLALFGWSKEDTDGAVEMVKCDACFRRLGLWLFHKSPSTHKNEDDISSMDKLNLEGEHRDYCPWVNSASQAGSKPGWEVLLTILKNSIPGNLVAAPAPSRPQTPVSVEKKTEEQIRADDEGRWKRLKSLRKVYGPNFGMKILTGKTGDKKPSIRETTTTPSVG